MTKAPFGDLLQYLRRMYPADAAGDRSDGELLNRFVAEREETAFTVLVRRHGPMVLGVCERLLGDRHLAEDAFQATFLVLARRAASVGWHRSVGTWLYAVAQRVALKARAKASASRNRERESATMARAQRLDEHTWQELRSIIDEEIGRLPEKYQAPLVLCYLEGKSHDRAAKELDCAKTTLERRLSRGRELLRKQLIRRGVTLSATVLGAALSEKVMGAPVAALLTKNTVQAAVHVLAGKAIAGGCLTARALALAEEAMVGMASVKGKLLVIVVALGLAVGGAGWAGYGGLVHKSQRADAPKEQVRQMAQTVPAIKEGIATVDGQEGEPLPHGAVGRFGSGRLRIGDSAFVLTPDGKSIIALSPEGIVRKLDAHTGRLLERRQLTNRSDVIAGAYIPDTPISSDGTRALVVEWCDGGSRATVWDIPSGKLIVRHNVPEGRLLTNAALSPDGSKLAVILRKNNQYEARVHDLEKGGIKEVGQVDQNVRRIRFASDGTRLVVSSGSIACFDVPAARQLWKVPVKAAGEFALSPDGKTVVVAEFDGNFHVIETDPVSGKPIESFRRYRYAHPNVQMIIAPDNHTLVISYFYTIITFDIRTGKEIDQIPIPDKRGRGFGPDLGGMSPDGQSLITNRGYLQHWDLTTKKAIFEAPPDDGLGGHIENVAFTADGKELLAWSSDLCLARWDVATRKRIEVKQEGNDVSRQMFSTQRGLRTIGRRSYRPPYEVNIRDPLTEGSTNVVHWADPAVEEKLNLALGGYLLTSNGRTLLSVYPQISENRHNTFVTATDVTRGKRLTQFFVPGYFFSSKAPFSPCGRWVVLGGKVYHVGTGTEFFTPTGQAGEPLLWFGRDQWSEWAKSPVWFSEDSRLMAGWLMRKVEDRSIPTHTLAIWEMASGKTLAEFQKPGMIVQVVLAPDGRTMALLDGQGIHIHDLLTAKELASYSTLDVTCNTGSLDQLPLAFSPDGRALASGHGDGSIYLWKVPRPTRKGISPIDAAEREQLWADLKDDSAVKGRAAVDRLISDAAGATALIAAKDPVAVKPADQVLPKLVKDLDSDVFATREAAIRKLRKYGASAEGILGRALAGNSPLEVKNRIERLLADIFPALPAAIPLPLSGESLRQVRAIEVLERAGTREAQMLLRTWAERAEDPGLAAEAKAAVERVR